MKKQPPNSVGEILFVTALVGLLVSIICPVVAGRRLTGDAAVCLSNQRKIGVALRLYADDYDGFFPMNRFSATQTIWKDAVWPYLAPDVTQAKTVLTCPGNFAVMDAGGDESGRWPRSYGYNADLEWGKIQATQPFTPGPFRITDSKAPGRYMLVLETRNTQPDLGPLDDRRQRRAGRLLE